MSSEKDVRNFDGYPYRGVDLLAGGVPCPPFSVAGKQLGADDERDLFPEALRLVRECEPTAVMLENVSGLSQARFASYREQVLRELQDELDYKADWQVLNACEFGVPQLRPRFILVAMKPDAYTHFEWPNAIGTPPTVGEALRAMMAETAGRVQGHGPRWPTASARRWWEARVSTEDRILVQPVPAKPGASSASTAEGWPTRRLRRMLLPITCRG